MAAFLTVLAACGGGGDDSFSLTIGNDFSTTLDKVMLTGTMSLPAGSERAGGTPFVTTVTCQIGPYTMRWSNAANGATGAGYALWDCPKDVPSWSAPGIPLAMGANRITVTMKDSSRTAEAAITITRN